MATEAADNKQATDSLPWVEKYRPSVLTDLISNEDVISTISRLIDGNRMPNMLLYGPPGTGKTSTVLACARKLNGPNFQSMTLELNASDDTGIDIVREQIKTFASTKKIFSSGYKLVILDEADAMSKDAQFALRRVIEKYTKNTRFCLICNYVNKIIPALQSRCTRFRFGPLQKEQITVRMRYIAEQEGVNLTDDGMDQIIKLANGDMRKCLNVLQATHMAYPIVDQTNVCLCTGSPLPSDINAILDALMNKPFVEAYNFTLELQREKGLALVDILNAIHTLILAVEMPSEVTVFMLEKMADVQHRLSVSSAEAMNLGSLVGIFQLAKEKLVKMGMLKEDGSKA